MRIPPAAAHRIEATTGADILQNQVLSGGCIGDVRRVDLADGVTLVAKFGGPQSGLALEGRMLRYLKKESALPVPEVIIADDDLLVMAYLPAGGHLDSRAQHHAADLVAALHEITGPNFGFAYDTVIGGLPQANTESPSWITFFREHRLFAMADQAVQAGRLPTATRHRLDRLAGRLEEWIDTPGAPRLLHGDLWGGNILAYEGRITGFIDPAIYHGDPEIELAFTTLFHTFGEAFFDRYREHRPIEPGFFEARRDLYNLYPLLVHVRLFGGAYVGSVEHTLGRFGC